MQTPLGIRDHQHENPPRIMVLVKGSAHARKSFLSKRLLDLQPRVARSRKENRALLELRIDIAPEETEATVLAVPTWLVASDLTLEVLGLTVTTGNQVKYLGVWLERNESCRKHLVELHKGAESRVNILSRLPALKCPTRRKARLYAAPTWAGLIKTKRDKQWLTSASRVPTSFVANSSCPPCSLDTRNWGGGRGPTHNVCDFQKGPE